MIPKINSAHGSETRNIINRAIEVLNVQGKTIQDLVADGQLTEEQYAELITVINGHLKSGDVDKSDLSSEFKGEIEGFSTQLAEKVNQIVLNGNNIEFYANSALIKSVSIVEAGNTTAVQDYIDTLVTNGQIEGMTLSDKSVGQTQLTDEALNFLSTTKNELVKRQDMSKFNKLKGVNLGNTLFYKTPAALDLSYVDNDSFMDVEKMIRFNYIDGTCFFAVNQTFDHEAGSPLPVWGAWIRKIDLQGLGSRRLYTGLKVDGYSQPIRTDTIAKEELTTVGFTNTYNDTNGTVKLSVLSEHDGWMYIQARLLEINVPLEGYYPRWVLNESVGAGKLDIVNFTMLETHNDILPQFIYAEKESDIPFTQSELNAEVRSLKNSNMLQSEWFGKKAAMIGDSLVQGGGYDKPLNEKLGFAELRNYGVAGRPMANGTANGPGNNTTGRMLAGETLDYSPIDLVMIAAGTNDFKLNVPIGQIQETGYANFNTDEFYGAYQDLIEYLLTVKSTMRIVLMTPLHRDNSGYDIYSANTEGHKLDDYRQAIFKIGENYSLPVIDMYANAGINKLNFYQYAPDKLHINELGGERAGGYLAHQIAKIGL